MKHLRLPLCFLFPALLLASENSDRQLKRIFDSDDFKIKTFGPARWIEDGAAYTTVEDSAIVRYETASGKRTVPITSAQLTPARATKPLGLDDYTWSSDSQKLLIYTESQRVWRQKTRGDYWVLDRARGTLVKLGGNAKPSSLMFAKFSPDGSRVAYVRENNIYCQDLRSGAIKALTSDGSTTLINGTFDWVNEEEFKLRDGFRWSPDGRQIAYWQFDTTGIPQFALMNNTAAAYPEITYIPYPQTGGQNSSVRVGVVGANGGAPRWMSIPGDPHNHYFFRMTWTETAGELLVGQLNRLQNTMTLFLANAATGAATPMFQDKDDTWVNVRDDQPDVPVLKSTWLDGGKNLLWISERDGWNHVYSVSRQDGSARLLTPGANDIISVAAVDPRQEWLYSIASPENATQRYLYRSRMDRPGPAERLTPESLPGTHTYTISPDCRWAFHTYSTFTSPPVTDLISLPDHKVVRTLEDNAKLREATRTLTSSAEFFQVKLAGGLTLDGFLLKPSTFDPARKYPAVVYVYGEPANASVVDRWIGDRALFNRVLAEDGYLVICVDNRSTPVPKGRAWRKSIYKNLGVIPPREQVEALQALIEQRPYIDAERIGVWGWSSGGSNTLNLMFRSPETYPVGVAVAPVTDLERYDTIYLERYMGLPKVNKDAYWNASPIHFAEGLKGKLLLIHGSGDDNVHYQGAEMLINRLIELDKPFDFMEYPNRSHGISEGKGTSLHLHQTIARYFEEHLPAGAR